ncbi:hypothetical protein OSTOST_23346 [Ostertagia ostertagi]
MLVHLLLSKLDGFPRSVAEALPRLWKDKFKENESSTQMNAYMKLKTLRMEGDVTSYCVELEKLTQRAYPEASEQELSRTRASELVAQLSNWPEYLQLYTTMEVAPKQQAYEMVKTMAQRGVSVAEHSRPQLKRRWMPPSCVVLFRKNTKRESTCATSHRNKEVLRVANEPKTGAKM